MNTYLIIVQFFCLSLTSCLASDAEVPIHNDQENVYIVKQLSCIGAALMRTYLMQGH